MEEEGEEGGRNTLIIFLVQNFSSSKYFLRNTFFGRVGGKGSEVW